MTESSATSTSTDPAAPADAAHHAPRVIGSWGAFSIVAGSMIGVGIFIFLPKVASGVGTLPLFFGMLLLGGLFALAGSVACGELGAMIPKAGGDYVFQRHAYGKSVAFASGWVLFAAIFAGSIATLAIPLFQFDIGPLFGVDLMSPLFGHEVEGKFVGDPVIGHLTGAHFAALGLILLFTALNDLGTSVSAKAQLVLTLLPIAAMVVLAAVVLIVQPDVVKPPTGGELATLPSTLTLAGLATAFLGVNFIFSGWINIIYVASEVKDPGRTIPRSMISATGAVTILYMLMAAAFVAVLGLAGVASTGTPPWEGGLGFDAGTRTANALGLSDLGPVVLIIITLAILTSINATIMGGARVGYAMAADGAFWRPIAKLSGRRKTPRRSLWFLATLACLIVLSGTGEAIGEMTSLAMFVTGGLTVAAVFVLRRKMPDAPRPYRAMAYPILPGLYVVLAVAAIAAKIWDATQQGGVAAWYPLIGLGILCVTWVGHLIYSRRWKTAAAVSLSFLIGGALFDGAIQPTSDAHAAPPTPAGAADDVRP